VSDGIVVHRRPRERFEFQRPPDRLVGEPDLPSDRLVATGATAARQFGFDRIGGGQVERRIALGRRDDIVAPIRIRRHQLVSQRVYVGHGHAV
jgi:hypothetical protein